MTATETETRTGDDVAHIAAELQRMYQGPAWHGPSFRDVVDGISANQAAARPLTGAHTIFELVHHIGGWIGEVESRLRGKSGGYPAEGDWPANTAASADAWREVLSTVEARHRSLLNFLREMDRSRLHEVVEPNAASASSRKVTAYMLLHGLVQHNAYHIGQIAILRKGLP